MNEELKEQILKLLADHLELDVHTTSEYVGCLGGDGGSLYKDSHKIRLLLDGEVISVAYL